MFSAPTSIAPAASSRATSVASAAAGGRSRLMREPASVGRPATSIRFFTANGTPASGPTGLPARHRRIDRGGPGERAFGGDRGEGVQHRIAHAQCARVFAPRHRSRAAAPPQLRRQCAAAVSPVMAPGPGRPIVIGGAHGTVRPRHGRRRPASTTSPCSSLRNVGAGLAARRRGRLVGPIRFLTPWGFSRHDAGGYALMQRTPAPDRLRPATGNPARRGQGRMKPRDAAGSHRAIPAARECPAMPCRQRYKRRDSVVSVMRWSPGSPATTRASRRIG